MMLFFKGSVSILGLVLMAMPDRLAEAVDAFKTAVELDPDNAAGHANLGSALLRARSPEAAAQSLVKAVALGPQGFNTTSHRLLEKAQEAMRREAT